MMVFTVIRKDFTVKSTVGDLFLADFWLCRTLEDVVRPAGIKVPGATAIPEGRYQLIIDMSARFKKLMPHLLAVPGFDGIRIHKLNTAEQTEGCIGVGMYKGQDRIWDCDVAYNYFFERLSMALEAKEEVFIEVTHAN